MDFLEKIAKGAMYKLMEGIENSEDRIIYKIKENILELQRRFILNVFSSLVILASLIFLSIAGVFLLVEYLALTKTLAFGIGGLILLLLGVIIKSMR